MQWVEQKPAEQLSRDGVREQGERERLEEWAEGQRGGGETTTRGQSGGTGDVQPRREQSRLGEAERQGGRVTGDGQHCSLGGEPPSGWKHREWVKGAKGEKEV